MKITLESTFGELSFKGINERNQSLQLSGNKESVSPMEAVLMSVAGCSAIDVEVILKKMHQKIHKIEVKVEGQRANATPSVFTEIHLHYIITGDVKKEKAQKAVEMSMNEYCSVSKMLSNSVIITHSFEVHILD